MRNLIILIISFFISSISYTQVLVQDSLALVDFYYATNGPGWQYSSHWLTDPVNEWFGINTSNNRVKEINLYDNNLDGELPVSIGDLTALEWLNVSDNQLYGNIPDEIANLSQLKTLLMSLV